MATDFIKTVPGGKMRVRILEGVVVNAQPQTPGTVLDVSDYDGRYLIGSGRAEKFVELAKPAVEPEPAKVEKVVEVSAVAKPKAESKKTEK